MDRIMRHMHPARAQRRPNARRWWLGAAVLLGVSALAGPRVVPLYDGVGFPDEAYRYVAPPAGAPATAAPTSAQARGTLVDGRLHDELIVDTRESGPQLSLYLGEGAVRGTGGDEVLVTATPVAPDAGGPAVDGNVYRVTLATPVGVPLAAAPPGSAGLLVLRATSARQPGPTMEYRRGPGTPWTAMTTQRGGQDIYSTGFVGSGDYALTFSAGPGPAATSGASGGRWLLGAVLAGTVVLLALVLLLVRRRTRRGRSMP